ncbi:AGAP005247-PA, partial [Anopheles gambiae str. PEST]
RTSIYVDWKLPSCFGRSIKWRIIAIFDLERSIQRVARQFVVCVCLLASDFVHIRHPRTHKYHLRLGLYRFASNHNGPAASQLLLPMLFAPKRIHCHGSTRHSALDHLDYSNFHRAHRLQDHSHGLAAAKCGENNLRTQSGHDDTDLTADDYGRNEEKSLLHDAVGRAGTDACDRIAH